MENSVHIFVLSTNSLQIKEKKMNEKNHVICFESLSSRLKDKREIKFTLFKTLIYPRKSLNKINLKNKKNNSENYGIKLS